MIKTEHHIIACAKLSSTRFDFWKHFIRIKNIERMMEVGVYRGEFAAHILKHCAGISQYYMLDPWRHLDDWNKPANTDNETFEHFMLETMAKTDFAAEKRVVLRGKTTEVMDSVSDGALDFAYVDGDHTLKGISIDLIQVFPKIREGGWIGGDDFSHTIWQHKPQFEPTLVFPFAVYFAEAVGAKIYALPWQQFLIEKQADQPFSFVDMTGKYKDTSLHGQFLSRPS